MRELACHIGLACGAETARQKVRALAQRSAEAAKEIKTLIGASVDKVESGARLVQDAGSTMDEIVSGGCSSTSLRAVSGEEAL